MNELMIIPKRINVGFQERSDTYTQKLAYVIYYDEKGKLRKETSWENWRDKSISNKEFDNEPISGFVLNKGVGGARESYGWNARNEYVRIYDPRDFEFEISVANLLFILQETSSIRGKGLEGDFIYAWSGKELVLLPVSSNEYITSINYTSLQTKKITAKEMIKGCIYTTKEAENIMYLGRHPWNNIQRINRYHEKTVTQNMHTFINIKDIGKDPSKLYEYTYIKYPGFTKLASVVESVPHIEFANEYEKLINSRYVSKPMKIELRYNDNVYNENMHYDHGAFEKNSKIYSVDINKRENRKYDYNIKNYVKIENDIFDIKYNKLYTINENGVEIINEYGSVEDNITNKEELKKYKNNIICICENGAEFKL